MRGSRISVYSVSVIPDRAFCFKTDFSLNLLRLIVYNTMIKKEAFVTIKNKEKKKSQTFLEKNGLMCTHYRPIVFHIIRNREKWDYVTAAIVAFDMFCYIMLLAKVDEGWLHMFCYITLTIGLWLWKIFGIEQKCVIIYNGERVVTTRRHVIEIILEMEIEEMVLGTTMEHDEVWNGPYQKLFLPNKKFNGKVDAANDFAREQHLFLTKFLTEICVSYSIEIWVSYSTRRLTQELLFEIFLRIGSG